MGLFDDLLDSSDAKSSSLSRAAIRDLKRLEEKQPKKHEPPAATVGRPKAVVFFVVESHCQCGAVHKAPRDRTAMLKVCFLGPSARAIYVPLFNLELWPDLPRRVETILQPITSCHQCFPQFKTPASHQAQICCIYCRGDHVLEDCAAEGAVAYLAALREDKQCLS